MGRFSVFSRINTIKIIGALMVLGLTTSNGVAQTAGRHGCRATVEFRYSDKGYEVQHTSNPAGSYSGSTYLVDTNPRSRINAYARPGRVRTKATSVGTGCNRKVIAEWEWMDKMKIVMRPASASGLRAYNRTLNHEMEHIYIFQNTPKEYEGKIKRVLEMSSNPSRDYHAIFKEIRADMERRNRDLDIRHIAGQ